MAHFGSLCNSTLPTFKNREFSDEKKKIALPPKKYPKAENVYRLGLNHSHMNVADKYESEFWEYVFQRCDKPAWAHQWCLQMDHMPGWVCLPRDFDNWLFINYRGDVYSLTTPFTPIHDISAKAWLRDEQLYCQLALLPTCKERQGNSREKALQNLVFRSFCMFDEDKTSLHNSAHNAQRDTFFYAHAHCIYSV